MVDLTGTDGTRWLSCTGHLMPDTAVPGVADDVHRVRAEKLRQRAPIEHNSVKGSGQCGAEGRTPSQSEDCQTHGQYGAETSGSQYFISASTRFRFPPVARVDGRTRA